VPPSLAATVTHALHRIRRGTHTAFPDLHQAHGGIPNRKCAAPVFSGVDNLFFVQAVLNIPRNRSGRIVEERWSMRFEPLLSFLMVGKFADHDAVDRRRSVPNTIDLVAGHFPNPQHPRSLQTRVREVDRAVCERLVEIASLDQNQRHHVA
jgi:hypothetical protein